jgi:hypothetical protein
MALVVKQHKPANPLYISLLGPQAVVPDPNLLSDTVEQAWLFHNASLPGLHFILCKLL